VRAEQMSKLKDVGRRILLPFKWAKFLGRRADPVCAGSCSRCPEKASFEACLSFGSLTSQLCSLTSIFPALLLVALFPIRGLLHLQLKQLH